MFTLIWRFIPGPRWFRVVVILFALAALVYALITWVYPWVATVIPEPQSTLDAEAIRVDDGRLTEASYYPPQ